jgi:hypothetical protein
LPKSSRFSIGTSRRMREIAVRIQDRMRQLGLSAGQLSDACSIAVSHLEQETEPPGLRRDRIAKILMNRQAQPGSSAASRISHEEMLVLARVLKVSVEWLSVQTENEEPVVWNVLAQPERGTHVLHLLGEYEERAGESSVWSEYPLCSFTTEEFMVAFHRAHFGEMDTAGVTKDKRELVEFFNRTGRVRRKRVLRPDRPYTFTGLIYESELQRVMAGEGVHRSIPKMIRKATFAHMARILADPDLKMSLVVVNEEKVRSAKAAWRDHETVGVMGELFSLWNYHSGSVGWSENPRHVKHQRGLINEMKNHAVCRDTQDTIEYIRQLGAAL